MDFFTSIIVVGTFFASYMAPVKLVLAHNRLVKFFKNKNDDIFTPLTLNFFLCFNTSASYYEIAARYYDAKFDEQNVQTRQIVQYARKFA